jgi:hypothetical protein
MNILIVASSAGHSSNLLRHTSVQVVIKMHERKTLMHMLMQKLELIQDKTKD